MTPTAKLLAFGFQPIRWELVRDQLGYLASERLRICGEVRRDRRTGTPSVCMTEAAWEIASEFKHATDGRQYGGRHRMCERHAMECIERPRNPTDEPTTTPASLREDAE